MESHPNCTCYTHNSLTLNTITREIGLFNTKLFGNIDFSLEAFLYNGWFTPTASLLFRREAYQRFEDLPSFTHGDYSLTVNLLLWEEAYLHYSDEIMSVYRDSGWVSTYLHDKQIELCDDFIALLKYFNEKSDHRYETAFDQKINEQIQRKERLIKKKNTKPKSRSFIARVWRKIGNLLCLES